MQSAIKCPSSASGTTGRRRPSLRCSAVAAPAPTAAATGTSTKQVRVAVLGASGYTGEEVVRLLSLHPTFKVTALTGDRQAGKAFSEVFPHLITAANVPTLCKIDDVKWDGVDAVFCCLPHATTQEVVKELPQHVKVVDLSADFRLRDVATYAEWYGGEHKAVELQKEVVYGLTELNREAVKAARVVANPGCYPTSVQLPLVPLIEAGLILTEDIIIDAKSGISGAGRSAKQNLLYSEATEGINAYGVTRHRHMPEIEQGLTDAAGKPVRISFTPHLMPMTRGMEAACYVKMAEGVTVADLRQCLESKYKDEPFVHLLAPGVVPQTHHVRGSNYNLINVFEDRIPGRAIVLSVIDNLVKGASGQAIQNMNLLFGLPEETALLQQALFPHTRGACTSSAGICSAGVRILRPLSITMRGAVVFLVALGLTAFATPAHSRTLSQAATTNAIWCMPVAATDAGALTTCNAAFSCVAGGDANGCQKMVADGDADLVVLGGSTQLPANTNLGLEPIAAEYYGLKDGVEYYSVAVVNKDFCSGTKSFKDLKGKRSCHTGYRKTAGWMMPVGILTADGTIPRVDSNDAVQADAESVASFFSTTCAPSTSDDFAEGPMLGGGKFDGLCTGCKGDCTVNDNYADYAGSLRCLMEDAGDVAFVKQSTPVEYASDGAKAEAWSSIASADMMLLCPNGGCAAIGDYESCNLAKVPARAVMSRAGMRSSTEGKAIAAALESGGTALADGIKAISTDGEVLLGASTQSLKAVDIPFEEYFGASSKAAYESITELDALATAQATGAPAPSSSSSGVSSGAAAGIGIGCAVAGILIGVVAMKLLNKKRSKYAPHADTAAVNAGNGASSEWGGNGKL
ncbi:putative N-acetyl-gamma-glutamyl-phosphate reductase [Chlorella vulgaris]